MPTRDPFGARASLGPGLPDFYRLAALAGGPDLGRTPVTVKILLENVLRHAGGGVVAEADVRAPRRLAPRVRRHGRDPVPAGPGDPPGLHRRAGGRGPRGDARRDGRAGRRPRPRESPRPGRPRDRPLGPGRSVRDGRRLRLQRRPRVRAERRALPAPALGPARLPRACGSSRRAPGSSTRSTSSSWPPSSPRAEVDGGPVAFPDTLVGTDSHTTMVNALGVLGYGVGGIEAEAVLLGQPLYQPWPRVVGVRLSGEMPRGATATDLVLVRDRARCGSSAWSARSWSSPATAWPGSPSRTGPRSAT